MSQSHGLYLSSLAHENFSIVLTYAFSQRALGRMLEDNFRGEHKFLSKACFETSRQRAHRALLELATQLRVLDDAQSMDEWDRRASAVGTVIKPDGVEQPMHLRDFTNKILHSAGFEWKFPDDASPTLICLPSDDQRWVRAEIPLVWLAALCSRIMG
jgi:hypothetical protein